MNTRRKTIPLAPHEEALLKELYLEYRFPTDQFDRRPGELRAFVSQWNQLSSRSDPPGEVLRFMICRRKNKRWPTFEGKHHRLAGIPQDFLSPAEWDFLKVAYSEVCMSKGLGSDNLQFDPGLARKLGKAFASRAGRIVPPNLLFAAIEAKRKRGLWLTMPERDAVLRGGFADMDELTGT